MNEQPGVQPPRGPAFDVEEAIHAHIARLELGIQAVENENHALASQAAQLEEALATVRGWVPDLVAFLGDVVSSRASAPIRAEAGDWADKLSGRPSSPT